MNLKMQEVYFIVTITVSLSMALEKHVDFISDLYEFSNRSSLTLLHFSKNDDFIVNNLIFKIETILLKKGFTVSNVNIQQIKSSTRETFQKSANFVENDKIMIVFLITSELDYHKVSNITKLLIRKRTLNILLFANIGKPHTSKTTCTNPNGNPLELNAGVSILVKCYDDPTIREWNADNNKIQIIERAVWKPKSGFVLKSKKLVIGNREFLRNKILHAASITETDTMSNYFYNLCVALEKFGNFTIKKMKMEEHYGIPDERNQIWNGAIGLIIDEQIDIALGFFTILPRELDIVDFTASIIRAEYVIIIKKPESKILILWSAYFKPFTLEVWLSIIITFIIIQMICIFMKNNLPVRNLEKSSYADDFLNIYGIFCRQEVKIATSATSLRIFYISIIFFSFLIWSIYSASFVSHLTTVDSNVRFKSMDEFTKVKSHKLIVFKETSNYYKLKNATHSPLKEAAELLVSEDELPTSNEEAIEKICENEMALFIDDIFLPIMHHNNISNICNMITIPTGEFDSFALILKKYSPYTAAIDYYIRQFHEKGILTLQNSAIYKIVPKQDVNVEFYSKFTSVTVLDVAMILTILLTSFCASFGILFIEKLHFCLENTKARRFFLDKIHRPKIKF